MFLGQKIAMASNRSRSALEWILITAILLAAALLRTYDLGNVPKGLEHDEVATWHMADGVLQGKLYLYFEEGYGHEPLFNYLTAIPLALFGPNWLGLRFWAPWFGVLAVAGTYALTRRMFGPLVALAGAGYQATTVWALFFNRLGLRLNQLPFLLCVTAYCFWRGIESIDTSDAPGLGARLKWFVAAGVLMGSTLYTYMSSRVVPLIFASFSVYLVARARWWAETRASWQQIARRWWPVAVAFIVAALVMAPLVLYLLNRPTQSDIPQREGQVDVPLQELLSGNPRPVLENAWALLRMWNVDGERYWQLNYSHRPVFVEPVSGLLFWLGLLWALWRWREPRMALLLLWAGFGMVPSLLTSEAPSWPRTMLASPAALALPGIGVAAAVRGVKQGRIHLLRGARASAAVQGGLLGLLAVALALNGGLTWRDLIVVWPAQPRVRYAFQSSMTEALRALDASEDTSPVVAAGLSPHDMDPWTEQCTLQRDDLALRWVDTRSALVLPSAGGVLATETVSATENASATENVSATTSQPAGERARLVILDITPLDPVLAAWAGLDRDQVLAQGEVVPRGGTESEVDAPVYWDPAYTIYALDLTGLRARIARAGTAAYVGADAFRPEREVTQPAFGGLVRLVGYEWLAPPRAGEPAQLLTYWRALETGPRSTLYGEPALRTFLHLLDQQGQVAARVDVLGAAPDTWQPGDVIVQLHTLDAPTQPGRYAVEVGWYVPPDGPRLGVDESEAPGERVLLEPVEVAP
jgi:4-amino-4-deoxy-L-arabinose transferase-like glycosyltransferase